MPVPAVFFLCLMRKRLIVELVILLYASLTAHSLQPTFVSFLLSKHFPTLLLRLLVAILPITPDQVPIPV